MTNISYVHTVAQGGPELVLYMKAEHEILEAFTFHRKRE